MLLPSEVLEIVFSYVPLADLLGSVVFVCKQWHSVISRDKFLKWKKLFYKLCSKKELMVTKASMEKLCNSNGMTDIHSCMKGVIRFMMNQPENVGGKRLSRKYYCWPYLRKHKLYNLAEKLLMESYPEMREPDVWGVVAMIVIISQDSLDIYHLFKLLIADENSSCSLLNLSEKLYCLATFFLHFVQEFGLPPRLLFNLRYALNLNERLPIFPFPDVGRAEHRETHNLSIEQLAIVKYNLNINETVKIIGSAGTGKTTTLMYFVQRRPFWTFLIICSDEIALKRNKKTFQMPNARCVLPHDLAQRVVSLFSAKKRVDDRMTSSYDLVKSNLLPGRTDKTLMVNYTWAKLTLRTLACFINSADESVDICHVPSNYLNPDQPILNVPAGWQKFLTVSEGDKKEILSDAKMVWNLWTNPSDDRLAIPLLACIKLWQMQKPNIFDVFENINCIIVDDCEDMPPMMLDVIYKQQSPKLLVEDPNQQINLDILDDRLEHKYSESVIEFHLNQSFRYGPEIAFIANSCANHLKKADQLDCLAGGAFRDEICTAPFDELLARSSHKDQICFIGLSSAALLGKISELIGWEEFKYCKKSSEKSLKMAFVEGLDFYQFHKIIDIHRLRNAELEKIQDPFLKQFSTYKEFTSYVAYTDDEFWQCKLFEFTFHSDDPEGLVKAIEMHTVNDVADADVILATSVTAKGMEWDSVGIVEGFYRESLKMFLITQNLIISQKESNQLYVAITRARRKLVISNACLYLLASVGDRHERVVETRVYMENFPERTDCVFCWKPLPFVSKEINVIRTASLEFFPATLTKEDPFNQPRIEGLLCSKCAGQSHISLCKKQKFYDFHTSNVVMLYGVDHFHSALGFLVGTSQV